MKNKEVNGKVITLSLRIVLVYIIYGLAWIFFTDKLTYLLIQNPYFLTVFQTTKGFLFICISALILYSFLWNTFAKMIHSENKIKEAETKWRSLVQNAPDVIMLIDRSGSINYVNRNIDGILKEDAVGKNINDFLPSEFKKRFKEIFMDVINEGAVKSLEVNFRPAKEPNLWYETIMAPLENGGEITGVISFARNVTKRREAEQEVFLLAHAIKSISEGVVITDLGDRILFVNNAFLKTYGYTKEQVVGKSIDIIRSDNNSPDLLEKIKQETLNGGWNGELNNKRKDGSEFPILLSTSIIAAENSEPAALIGVSKDISEQKKAERALRESEEKYRTLFEDSKDVVFISTPEGRFLDINQAGVELFGYSSKEELLKVNIADDLYCNPEDREQYKAVLAKHGFARDFESVIRHKDGRELIVLETARAEYDEEGKITKHHGFLRDITEKKHLENQLRQAQKLQSLGTLAGGIAHDFNNILGIILGYASMLEIGHSDPKKLKWKTSAIINAVNRGTALVQQILTFARKKDILFETVKLNAAISELVKLTQETFPKTITFTLDLQKDLPFIKADHNQIHQALLNLCVNARDAMPKGGVISLKTTIMPGSDLRKKFPDANDENYAAIILSDTGIGMDKETVSRVFEPFFTTKKRGKGTGLGLAVVYGVVSSHHGFIDVESEIGGGTSFHIYFPIAEEFDNIVESDPDEQNAVKGGAETILFVEDEKMLCELGVTVLAENGYQVLTAGDGEEAVEVFAQNANDIELVITDLGLPKLDGWKAYLKMREQNPDLKMILVSGYLSPEIKAELSENSTKFFVQKPYNLQEMLKKVREVFDYSPN